MCCLAVAFGAQGLVPLLENKEENNKIPWDLGRSLNAAMATKSLSDPLLAAGLGSVRIPVLLMTAFASVVDLLPALQHLRRVLRICRIDR